jgi:hypothetical protein
LLPSVEHVQPGLAVTGTEFLQTGRGALRITFQHGAPAVR